MLPIYRLTAICIAFDRLPASHLYVTYHTCIYHIWHRYLGFARVKHAILNALGSGRKNNHISVSPPY